jgi:hypothetical protein
MRTDGQTDRHDESNSRFPQLHERAYKPVQLCQYQYRALYEATALPRNVEAMWIADPKSDILCIAIHSLQSH